MKKALALIVAVVLMISVSGCTGSVASGTASDINATIANAGTLSANQPTPTDIDYSLERYNLIRRAYNEYILQNSFVWNGNVPDDIDSELPIIE